MCSGKIFVGGAFDELHFGAAFDRLAERRVDFVAADGGVELAVVNAAGFFGDRCEQRVVALGVRALEIGDANLQIAAERLFVAAGDESASWYVPSCSTVAWPTYMPGVGFGGELDRLAWCRRAAAVER